MSLPPVKDSIKLGQELERAKEEDDRKKREAGFQLIMEIYKTLIIEKLRLQGVPLDITKPPEGSYTEVDDWLKASGYSLLTWEQMIPEYECMSETKYRIVAS